MYDSRIKCLFFPGKTSATWPLHSSSQLGVSDLTSCRCVLAGPASAVQRIAPYCKGVMGRANIDLSNQPPGKATLLKLIGDTFILNMVETLSEGHTLAEKSGLGSDTLHQFIETMFPGPYTAYSGRMMSGDYYKRDEVRERFPNGE